MHRDDLKGKRGAAYARYSSDKQSDLSVDDQIRRCRDHVRPLGGVVNDEALHFDRAESGSSLQRGGGIERLLRAIRNGEYEYVVIESLSRLTRDFADGAVLLRELDYQRVRLIAVADGIDSVSHGSQLLMGLKLVLNNQYSRDQSDQTRRGMKGRALAGLSTGLLPFGYCSERDPASDGKLVLIDEDRRPAVILIFEKYAGGLGLAAIAALLNREGIRPPRGNGRRKRQGWTASGVRAILHNEKYVGIWKYNQREYVKVPGSKRRISRLRPESEVVVGDYPDRRIVSDEVWQAVRDRFESNRKRYGKAPAAKTKSRSSLGRAGRPSQYLFSGLLECGACGAPMTIHGGGQGRRYYRCDDNAKRGTCENRLSVRERDARERLLSGLRDTLHEPTAVAYVRKEIAKALANVSQSGGRRTEQKRRELAAVEGRLDNLAEAIADGTAVDVLRDKLRTEDRLARELRVDLRDLEEAAAAPIQLPTNEEAVRAVFDLEARLSEGTVEANREALRSLLLGGTIRLHPEDGIYVAHADVLIFGLLVGGSRRSATEKTTPASGRGERYSNSSCGGRI